MPRLAMVKSGLEPQNKKNIYSPREY